MQGVSIVEVAKNTVKTSHVGDVFAHGADDEVVGFEARSLGGRIGFDAFDEDQLFLVAHLKQPNAQGRGRDGLANFGGGVGLRIAGLLQEFEAGARITGVLAIVAGLAPVNPGY